MGYELKCVLQRELDWSSDPVWMCLYFINKNLCRCNPVKMRLYWSRVSPNIQLDWCLFFFNGNFRDRAHQEDSMWSWRQSWEFRCLQLRRCCQKHREVWKDLVLEVLKDYGPADILTLGFQNYGENTLLLFEAIKTCSDLL